MHTYFSMLVLALLCVSGTVSGTTYTVNTPLESGHFYYCTSAFPAGSYTISVDIQITNGGGYLLILSESDYIKYTTGKSSYKVYAKLETDTGGRIRENIPRAYYPQEFRYLYKSTNIVDRAYAKGYIDISGLAAPPPEPVPATAAWFWYVFWSMVIGLPVALVSIITCCVIRIKDACKRKRDKENTIIYTAVPGVEMQPMVSTVVTTISQPQPQISTVVL